MTSYIFEFKVKEGADKSEIEDAIFDIIHNWYTDLEDGNSILDFVGMDTVKDNMLVRSEKE